jgi:Uri superfamily endonuclease
VGGMDDLTLEKLKIVERLDTINTAVITFTESHRQIRELLYKHDSTLYGDGNGNKGMAVRVDRLEQDFENRKWHIRMLWSAIVAAIAKILHLSLK